MQIVFGFQNILMVLFLCSITSSSFASELPTASIPSLKIMIDPGHGGSDAGAVYGSAKESEIALKVAQQLKALLEKNPGFAATLTRTADKNLSLTERVHLAEAQKADLFLSIHANASPDQRARGAEFYFQNHLPPDEESLFLANAENQIVKETDSAVPEDMSKKSDVRAIIEDLKRNTKMRSSFALSEKLLKNWNPGINSAQAKRESRNIRQAPFFVISKTTIPSVLVELGFISNPKESQRLIQPDYQKEIAQKIYRGLRDYKEMVDKSEVGRLH
jgi:N-acetylmuramoyl-L-alanine amidase